MQLENRKSLEYSSTTWRGQIFCFRVVASAISRTNNNSGHMTCLVGLGKCMFVKIYVDICCQIGADCWSFMWHTAFKMGTIRPYFGRRFTFANFRLRHTNTYLANSSHRNSRKQDYSRLETWFSIEQSCQCLQLWGKQKHCHRCLAWG